MGCFATMFLFQVSIIRSDILTQVPFKGNSAITTFRTKVKFLYCSFHLRELIFERLYFSFNYLMKAPSYCEQFVFVFPNDFREQRENFNIINAAFKLLERTKIGRHTVVFEIDRHTVIGDIQSCLKSTGTR
jgi:hypothetical protein